MSTTDAPDIGENDLVPHRAQLQFLRANKRYSAFVSGIGAGKTVAGILRLYANVYQWNPGKTGFVIAPTVPSLRNVIVPELEKWGVMDEAEFNASENTITFPNGSKVILESANNPRKIRRLRGPSIPWFWIDEAAQVPERAWEVMVGRLRDGDYLNAFVTTTPRGENWVHDRFVEGDPDDVNAILGIPTTANPHTPDEYKEEIVEEYDGQFYEQEIKGAFTAFEGLIYPWFDDDNLIESPPDAYDETIYGVDWGHNNPATIVAVVRQGSGDDAVWTVAEEWYQTRQTVNDHSRALQDMQDRWGPGAVYCDPAEPASIEQLQRDGIDAREADNDVLPGIQRVSSMQDNLRVVATCQNLRNEFSQYQYKGDDSDEPEKTNDHALDALRYALFSHIDRSKVFTGVVDVGDREDTPDDLDTDEFRNSELGEAVFSALDGRGGR